jgi:ketosteroid isomerase-like protein
VYFLCANAVVLAAALALVALFEETGGWAYEVGRFTATAPDGRILNAGRYIVIWHPQTDGGWKTHRDIFNWHIPPAG